MDLEDALRWANLFRNQVVYEVSQDGEIKFLACWLELNDADFDLIMAYPEVLGYRSFILTSLENPGNHIHFAFAVGDGKFIRNCLRKVINDKNPDTVTWYRDYGQRIHIKTIKRGCVC